MTKLAVIGLGAMGRRMACVLATAGHHVSAWNRTPLEDGALDAAGVRQDDDLASAISGAAVIISMLRDDVASRAVWIEGAGLDQLSPGSLLIECATVSPAWIAELAAAADARGLTLLEAPVLGSRPQVEAGALIFLLGGEGGDIERAGPLFEALGAARHHCGPLGHASAMKLAANSLFALQVAALGELLGYLRGQGFDEARAVELLSALPVTSPVAKAAAAGIEARAFAPLFPIELVVKDLTCLATAASDLGIGLPLAGAVGGVYRAALEAGRGEENITAVAAAYL